MANPKWFETHLAPRIEAAAPGTRVSLIQATLRRP
jgi:hypothetical protein